MCMVRSGRAGQRPPLIPIEDDLARLAGMHHLKSLHEIIHGKAMGDHGRNVQPALEHAGHFVPGLEHLTAIDAFQLQPLEDDLGQVQGDLAAGNAQNGHAAAVVHGFQHVPESLDVAGHFQPHIKSLLHAQLPDRVADGRAGYVDGRAGAHARGKRQAVIVDVGDHHMAGAHMPGNGHGHDADGAGAGDQDILAHQIEGERGVGGIAQGVEDGGEIVTDILWHPEDIGCRYADVLGETSRAVDAHADGVAAQVALAGPAVAAMPAGDVAFRRDAVSDLEPPDLAAHVGDDADEFVADGHGRGNGALGPGVPVVNVDVRSADRGLDDFDQHVIMADAGKGDLAHPDARLGLQFDDGLHGFHSRTSLWGVRG
ncbi:hypothetical protein DESC_610118 [Desulfosarcina cetonica]|nr:hypothetical protein DESC_610118 [Desulfosarcina cetonica]